MEEKDLKVQLEGVLEGKAFDVLSERGGEETLGYEVTLHFQNLVRNLREGLRTSVRSIDVVCANKDKVEKAKSEAEKGLDDLSRVEFRTIFEFTEKKN